MDLAHAVTVRIERPGALGTGVVHGPMGPEPQRAEPAVPLPFIRVDRRLLQASIVDDRL
jgi:hypothetical protein